MSSVVLLGFGNVAERGDGVRGLFGVSICFSWKS